MLHDLAYIQLSVTDLGRAVTFYRDTLGMTLLWYEARQGHAALATSAGPLVLRADGGSNPDGAGPLLAFEVEDIRAAVESLSAKGIVFPSGVDRHGGRYTARFHDPDGYALELNQTVRHGTG